MFKNFFVRKGKMSLPSWFFLSVFLLSFLGAINAVYLTVEHFKHVETGAAVVCHVEIMGDCNQVLYSRYSEIGAVPLALLGVAYYLFVFSVALILYFNKERLLFSLLSVVTSFGFLFSLLLVYLQIWVLRAVCPYCMFSALVSVLLFGIDIIFLVKKESITGR